MRMGSAAVLLAGLLATSCDDSQPAGVPPAADVKGTSFRAPKSAPAAPEEAALGDLDGGAPSDPPIPLPVPTPPPSQAPAPAPPPEPAAAAQPAAADEYQATSFDELAGFECAAYASNEKHPIPANIMALAGKKLVLDGYMMPLQYEAGGAKKFLLMRYKFGCCYAVSPKINEWIEVTMEKGVADYMPDTITSVWGVLSVEEEMREGASVGLYKMKAARAEFSEAK